MPATADHTLSTYSFVNPTTIVAPAFWKPEDTLGHNPYSRHKNPSSTVSNVFMFADPWVWNAIEGYATWFNPDQSLAAAVDSNVTWKKYVTDPKSDTEVDAISETIDSVFEVLASLGPRAIRLSGLTPRSVNGEHLAAVLRVTAPYRAEVPEWDAALRIAIEALNLAGLDHHDALAGLIEA